MYKFIGYVTAKGSMVKNGDTITWNNRQLKFITDNVADEVTGWDRYEVKVKATDLCKWFGINAEKEDDVNSQVNAYLNSVLGDMFTLDFVPRNGNLELNKMVLVTDYKPMDKASQKIISDKAT